MPVEFHCNFCGRLVRAPESAGGKHGKCPSCHQTVYVPTPPDQIEPLELSPVDPNEERERARLLAESQALQSRVLHERPTAESGPAGAAAPPPLSHEDVDQLVTEYVLKMASGDLEHAERIAKQLRRNMKLTEEVIDHITMDQLLPTALAKVPRPVVLAFLKQLREGK